MVELRSTTAILDWAVRLPGAPHTDPVGYKPVEELEPPLEPELPSLRLPVVVLLCCCVWRAVSGLFCPNSGLLLFCAVVFRLNRSWRTCFTSCGSALRKSQ